MAASPWVAYDSSMSAENGLAWNPGNVATISGRSWPAARSSAAAAIAAPRTSSGWRGAAGTARGS